MPSCSLGGGPAQPRSKKKFRPASARSRSSVFLMDDEARRWRDPHWLASTIYDVSAMWARANGVSLLVIDGDTGVARGAISDGLRCPPNWARRLLCISRASRARGLSHPTSARGCRAMPIRGSMYSMAPCPSFWQDVKFESTSACSAVGVRTKGPSALGVLNLSQCFAH